MKVYCKNCRHYFKPLDPACQLMNDLAHGTVDVCTYYGSRKPRNKNHNCKHYIRKWWKFWIKQPKLKGKIERLKAWPLPNISSSEIPKCPKCKTPHRRKK